MKVMTMVEMVENMMLTEEKATGLHKNKSDCFNIINKGLSVKADLVSDGGKRSRVELMFKTDDGELSDIIEILKSKMMKPKADDYFNSVLDDLSFNFSKEERVSIQSLCNYKMVHDKAQNSNNSGDLFNIIRDVVNHCRGISKFEVGFVEKRICYVRQARLNDILETLETGVKKLEFEKKLKKLGLLQINDGRDYDYNKKDPQAEYNKTGKPAQGKFIAIYLDEVEKQFGSLQTENETVEVKEAA